MSSVFFWSNNKVMLFGVGADTGLCPIHSPLRGEQVEEAAQLTPTCQNGNIALAVNPF